MKIEVSDKHIQEGRKMNCFSCPIALAINEQLGDDFVSVGYDSIKFFSIKDGDGPYKEIITPRQARAFVNRFDSRKEVKPFDFNLDYENA